MGNRRWDADEYDQQKAAKPSFVYSQKAMQQNLGVHESLDPKVSSHSGSKLRLALDPDNGKHTTPITVCIDVTGSGNEVPAIVREKLALLMNLLILKGYVEWPNIQIIGLGDAYTDRWPLQASQFEADVKIDDALTNLVLEGGGGGQKHESYELVMWYAVNMNQLQCWNWGEKGYLFFIGDELPYDRLNTQQIRDLVGENATNVLYEFLLDQLLEKYNVYYIICGQSSYYNNPMMTDYWGKILGKEFVIKLDDAGDTSPLIASLVGHSRGTSIEDIQDDLLELGAGQTTADAVTMALSKMEGHDGIVRKNKNDDDTGIVRF